MANAEFDQVGTELGEEATEASWPVLGHDALIHPEGGTTS